MTIVEDYMRGLVPLQRDALEQIRDIVLEIAPDAREALSYNMPAYKVADQYLIWFAAFKRHISIFPASDDMVEDLGEEVGKFRTSTGTLQFPMKEPLPEATIRKIVRYRLSGISGA